jgi:predicted ATPase/DNA-binding CsgD family transcriptional regulator
MPPASSRSSAGHAFADRGVTGREAEVLGGLVEHLSNAEIAARLVVSERTVESHVSSLLRKLEVSNRRELVRLASSIGATGSRTNVPRPGTALVGRDGDLRALVDRLPSGGLVTLTGPGGVGKTRLAVEAAIQVIEQFPGGVWFVDLAAVSDPGAVADRVLSLLGAGQPAHRSALAGLQDRLRGQQCLILLDSCEHLLAAAAETARALVTASPSVAVLATSREPLWLAAETVRPVGPLDLPARLADVATSSAVQLLAERARSAGAELVLTDASADAVVELCRRLDGLPLALELVAPRLRTYAPSQLLQLLPHRLDVLTAEGVERPPRHRTLRDAIAWSFELLSDKERLLFLRAAVFAGAFDVASLTAVVADDVLPVEEIVVLLPRLVDRSLVTTVAASDGYRYRLLDSLRDFALEHLDTAARATLRARHRRFLLALARQADAALRGPDGATWIGRLRSSSDDLEAVLEDALSSAPADALELVAALQLFWQHADLRRTGIGWAERALAAAPSAPTALRLPAVIGAGSLLGPWDRDRAAVLVTEARPLAKALGDPQLQAELELVEGAIHAYGGDRSRALPPLARALTWFQENGDRWRTAETLCVQSFVSDPRDGVHMQEEAYRLFALTGDRIRVANVAYLLADLWARELHEPRRAEPLAWEAVALARELGSEHEEAHGLRVIAECLLARGEPEPAHELGEQCLAAFRQLADHRCEAASLLLAQCARDPVEAQSHAQGALALAAAGGQTALVDEARAALAGIPNFRTEYGCDDH